MASKKQLGIYFIQEAHCTERIMPDWRNPDKYLLSKYLFILSAEVLAEAIRKNSKIRGIEIHDTEFKRSLTVIWPPA